MGLKTRLDGRSDENSSFVIKNAEGEVTAEIKLLESGGITLEVSTTEGSYIEKPSGWTSQRNK